MRKLKAVLCLACALMLCACSSAASTKTVSIKNLQLEIPESWVEKDLAEESTDFQIGGVPLEACVYWGETSDDSSEDALNGIMVMSETYEVFGNTDIEMPDVASSLQDAADNAKHNLDEGMKVLDARILIEAIGGVYGLTDAEGSTVTQTMFKLGELQGHPLWYYEGKTSTGPAYYSCVIFDERLVVVIMQSSEAALTEEQSHAIESMTCTDECDSLLLELAQEMEGQTEDEVMDLLKEKGTISSAPSSNSTSTDSTGYTSTEDDGITDVYDGETGTYVETDDGDILVFGDDGSVTQHNDLGITTFNSDGSKEWTDGWGTVVRDTDGDGEPDIISYDSGETWVDAS